MNIPDEHKMTAEQAEPWLAALESGNYEQIAGHLCAIDYHGRLGGYCCLGVRAAIAGAAFTGDVSGDVMVEIPGVDLQLNDSELLDAEYAKNAFGLSYDVQLLLSRLNDGTPCNVRTTNDPLIEVYKEVAARATPTTAHDVDWITVENNKHDFKMIAAVIRKYFIK